MARTLLAYSILQVSLLTCSDTWQIWMRISISSSSRSILPPNKQKFPEGQKIITNSAPVTPILGAVGLPPVGVTVPLAGRCSLQISPPNTMLKSSQAKHCLHMSWPLTPILQLGQAGPLGHSRPAMLSSQVAAEFNVLGGWVASFTKQWDILSIFTIHLQGPLLLTWVNLIPAWICNHLPIPFTKHWHMLSIGNIHVLLPRAPFANMV